ncbi:MAG: fatty acid/phospholipid synthesis protein PlsX [Candidatus Xenolissoclinum pacificiensis L6]|uniref:Phosphate acyltransferase n=1 Tax=Candidatus Xenolissoclinum pacificiensis L6 TaxID=1401685 RepID=W2UY53_9RICK|nr:MAG: fatty acid/phospholipid synthesis protein PlsX [Candidatus Xenolissoclinum pacificiensis L6]
MKNKIVIAVDVMGGDKSPGVVIEGIELFQKQHKVANLYFKLFGKKSEIESRVEGRFAKANIEYEIIDAPNVVLPDDKPSLVIRNKKDSSMYMAVVAIKNGEADAMVSGGNTGALMVVSRFVLGMLANINRPAAITVLPKIEGQFAILDLGANTECSSEFLVQFSIMGTAFARAVMMVDNPSVALLNIGSETNKGKDSLKEAFISLSQNRDMINFDGYIEPDSLIHSSIDVVVTDGFTGNILLKSAEGVFDMLKDTIRKALKSYFFPISSLISKYRISKEMSRFDPALRNGAILIGLNGIVVKSHGKSDARFFANAIKVAYYAVHNDINSHIVNSTEEII